jgi:hypothetical protein
MWMLSTESGQDRQRQRFCLEHLLRHFSANGWVGPDSASQFSSAINLLADNQLDLRDSTVDTARANAPECNFWGLGDSQHARATR